MSRSSTTENQSHPDQVLRAEAIGQVNEHLPALGPNFEHSPVLNADGPPGAGKTTLLFQLVKELTQKTPLAYVDCADYGPKDLRKLLAYTKFQLGLRCPTVKRVWFGRLDIAMAATREPIDFDADQQQVLRQIGKSWRRDLDEIDEMFGGLSADLMKITLPFMEEMRKEVKSLTSRTVRRIRSRPSHRRRYLRWHGHRDQNLPHHPLAELARLNEWARIPEHRRKLESRLVEALLADLRDAAARGKWSERQRYNCVLLLDNADLGPGRAFLDHLHGWQQHFQVKQLAPEPLLTVATSRRPLRDSNTRQLALPPLTPAEANYLASHASENSDHRLGKLVHAFAGGHPAAVGSLVNKVHEGPIDVGDGLEVVLEQSSNASSQDSHTVEDSLREDLVDELLTSPEQPPLHDGALTSLVTCAAARTLDEAEALAQSHSRSDRVDSQLLQHTFLWDTKNRSPAHKLLQWLLRRQLMRRGTPPDGEGLPSWGAVCRDLRDRNIANGHVAGELYYSLAAGQLTDVAHRLADLLKRPEQLSQPWIELLHDVATAPYPWTDRSAASPLDRQFELISELPHDADAQVHTARLLAGLWLHNHPCTGPDRANLHRQIAMDFQRLASLANRTDLWEEADTYLQLAHDWS